MANIKVKSQTYVQIDSRDGVAEYFVTVDSKVAESLLSIITDSVTRKMEGLWFVPVAVNSDTPTMERWRDTYRDDLRAAEALGLNKDQAWMLIEDLTGKRWN